MYIRISRVGKGKPIMSGVFDLRDVGAILMRDSAQTDEREWVLFADYGVFPILPNTHLLREWHWLGDFVSLGSLSKTLFIRPNLVFIANESGVCSHYFRSNYESISITKGQLQLLASKQGGITLKREDQLWWINYDQVVGVVNDKHQHGAYLLTSTMPVYLSEEEVELIASMLLRQKNVISY